MNLFDSMLNEIRENGLPVIIYGAGELSARVCDYLQINSISFEGYAVDKAYLPADRTKNGKPVFALEDYLDCNECNIIIGVMYFSEEKETAMKSHPNARNVFTVDFSGRFPLGAYEDCCFTQEYLEQNKDTLTELKAWLADNKSKEELDLFISQRMKGNFRKPCPPEPQYFEKEIITLSDNEVFVDCGAYDGDTVKQFVKELQGKPYKKIFAFEADPANVQKMQLNTKDMNNVTIVPKGVYNESTTLCFSSDGKMSSRISEDGIKLEVTAIDDIVGDESVTFIKMDIEGSELKALMGAEKTIRRCRPKLAICVYHRKEDIFTIPQYIKSLDPSYKLYFRNYHTQSIEAVIYAV